MFSFRAVLALCSVPALLLGSCRSADRVMLQPNPSSLSLRLPDMEVEVQNGPLNRSEDEATTDPIQLFRREAAKNLLEQNDSSTRFGYARLQVTQAKQTRTGKAWHVVQMIGMLTPSLLGIPMGNYHTNLTAELQIVDAQGNLLGTYTGSGKSKVRVAMYHGYSQGAAPRLADTEALRQALAQIKPQLDTAVMRLRPQLINSGALQPAVAGTGGLYSKTPLSDNSDDE